MGIHLKSIRSFHVGGRLQTLTGMPVTALSHLPGEPPRLSDMNGEHAVGQLYAQHFALESPRHACPILLWHGGGMTGVSWETTPSGQPGWLDYFLRAGYSVYVSDAFERGRASWPPCPEVLPSPPDRRTLASMWALCRFGPDGSYQNAATNRPHADLQFPIGHLHALACQMTPRWAGTDDWALDAYHALLERVGPCIVIGHSQGAYYALQCARQAPHLVKAVVAIEPGAVPDGAMAPGALPPHLWVWGDYLQEHAIWQRHLAKSQAYQQQLQQGGTTAQALHLPDEGIQGNSHLLIMDDNNQQIAARVDAWLQQALPHDHAA